MTKGRALAPGAAVLPKGAMPALMASIFRLVPKLASQIDAIYLNKKNWQPFLHSRCVQCVVVLYNLGIFVCVQLHASDAGAPAAGLPLCSLLGHV